MREHEASCLLIAKVLTADGMMAAAEKDFLRATMQTLGLTEEEQGRVLDLQGLDRAEAVLRSRPLEERRALLDRLLEAALADGRLSPHETEAVRSVTEALRVD